MSVEEMALVLCATGVSLLGTFVGAGGGFLMVPLLRLAFGVPVHTAVACSLAAIFPATLLSTLVNLHRGKVALRMAVALEATAVIAAVGGAALASYLPAATLAGLFGLFVGGLGLALLRERWTHEEEPPLDAAAEEVAEVVEDVEELVEDALGEIEEELPEVPGWRRLRPLLSVPVDAGPSVVQVSLPALTLVGSLAGFLAGLLGIGGGFLKTPALVHLFRVPATTAAATSLATVAVTSGVGAYTHYRLGNLDLRLAGFLIAGFLTGATLALFLDAKVDERRRQTLIAASLAGAGLSMLIAAAGGG